MIERSFDAEVHSLYIWDAQLDETGGEAQRYQPGERGRPLLLTTEGGLLRGVLHAATDDASAGVVLVSGAGGGFDGLAGGIYAALADGLAAEGIAALRLDYRRPNRLGDCVADLTTGVTYLRTRGVERVIVVGHSFGGAVAVRAGVLCRSVQGVVTLAAQGYGTDVVDRLAPKSLLVVHGADDEVLPVYVAYDIYERARHPKKLVIYDNAHHDLSEARAELLPLLHDWLRRELAAPTYIPDATAAWRRQ